MSTVGTALTVVLGIIAVLLIVVVLLQANRSAGLGAIGGGADNSSYWSKNKGNSVEGALEKYTKILGALFIIVALLVNFLG